MAEMAMAVDAPAPIASLKAPLSAPTLLPVVTTINSNGRIISTLIFVPKGLPAAIAAKPIPRRYTSSMETRPSIWVNAEKAHNLADCMEVTPMISTLKHLETHVADVILPPQDLSLKWQMPSPDFVFTADNFPYLPGSKTPLKHQCIDDGTVSLGSPMPPPTFTRDFDPDYFESVPIFIDHEPTADYIKQSLIWQCNVISPTYFGSIKNIFTCSVPVSLYGLVASACPTGVQYNFIDKCSYSRYKRSELPKQPQWLLDSGASMHFTGQ